MSEASSLRPTITGFFTHSSAMARPSGYRYTMFASSDLSGVAVNPTVAIASSSRTAAENAVAFSR